MFRSAQTVNLDSKGRLAIPTRYRADIVAKDQGIMVCTVDIFQPCLLLYPLHKWEEIEQMLSGLSSFDPDQRRIKRVMLGYATECELDAAGRILLSNPLRQHAKLEKNIMLVGQANKFEIWSEEQWHAQIKEDIEISTNGAFAKSEVFNNLTF